MSGALRKRIAELEAERPLIERWASEASRAEKRVAELERTLGEVLAVIHTATPPYDARARVVFQRAARVLG